MVIQQQQFAQQKKRQLISGIKKRQDFVIPNLLNTKLHEISKQKQLLSNENEEIELNNNILGVLTPGKKNKTKKSFESFKII